MCACYLFVFFFFFHVQNIACVRMWSVKSNNFFTIFFWLIVDDVIQHSYYYFGKTYIFEKKTFYFFCMLIAYIKLKKYIINSRTGKPVHYDMIVSTFILLLFYYQLNSVLCIAIWKCMTVNRKPSVGWLLAPEYLICEKKKNISTVLKWLLITHYIICKHVPSTVNEPESFLMLWYSFFYFS